MSKLLIADNKIDYWNEINKIYNDDIEDIIEIGWVYITNREYYVGIVSDKILPTEEIQDFLIKNNIRKKYGKLQRASESYRV